MKIINKTKNTILADNAEVAGSPFKRLKGLLGRKELKKGCALVIKPCNSVHTFFMLFNIDILIVDKANRVVQVVSSLKPFRMTCVYWTASYVIELPPGTIQDTQTSKLDLIQIEGS